MTKGMKEVILLKVEQNIQNSEQFQNRNHLS